MNMVLVAIVAYVLVQFAIGAWVSRRIASADDYILAGRQLGVGLVAFSVFATYFGAEAIVASGGSVYENGLSGALVDPLGLRGGAHHRRPVLCAERSGRAASPPSPTCSGSAIRRAWSGWW